MHPSCIRIRQKQIEYAVAMDNACNLAAELAGIAHRLQDDYYTKNRHLLSKQKKPLVKRRCCRHPRTNRIPLNPATTRVRRVDPSLALAPAEVSNLDTAPSAPTLTTDMTVSSHEIQNSNSSVANGEIRRSGSDSKEQSADLTTIQSARRISAQLIIICIVWIINLWMIFVYFSVLWVFFLSNF